MQCRADSQVWRVVRENDNSKAETLGLLVAYVDDLLLLMPNGSMKRGLIDHLRTLWNMSTEVDLTDQQKLTFLGLELERTPTGALLIHQRAFIEKLLAEKGFGSGGRGNKTVQMAQPPEEKARQTQPN